MMLHSALSFHGIGKLVFVCCCVGLWLFQCTAASQDAQTLLRVGHVDWINTSNALSSWNSASKSPCGWRGITCNYLNAVTTVNLTRALISGYLTSELCNLPSLATLILRENNFSGSFPHGLLECKRLRMLDLSQNQFAGGLPDRISELKELRVLNLAHNDFSGHVPADFGLLVNIEVLLLHSNSLNGTIPAFIGKLTKLTNLTLGENPLQPAMIPGELGDLKELKLLWLNKCNLTGKIPNSLANLTHLEWLDLSDNRLEGDIPADLMAFSKLKILYLWVNKLSGPIPSNIGGLKSLSRLDLSDNQLSGEISESISNLLHLEWLNLCDNQLAGDIPEHLGTLPRLTVLMLFNNKLTGLLPQNLGAYSNIRAIDVTQNKLEGPLPKGVCRHRSLVTLVVTSNHFNGSLPSALEDCPSLRHLMLGNNSLGGEIPARLWSAPNLVWMIFGNNKFQGQIPASIGQAKNLTILDVSNNNFSGSIPAEVGQLQLLDRLIGSNNRFSGSISAELTCLSSLTSLRIDHNFLSGEIPKAIKSWIKLAILNLSNNKLSGEIPESLGTLPVLNSLDLSNNFLSGRIPSELGSLKLSSFNVSRNRLSGLIPNGLDAFKNGFVGNPELCGARDLGLGSCPSSHKLSSWRLTEVLTPVLLLAAVSVCILYLCYFTNFCVRKPKGNLTWKLTSFHTFLGFDESYIIDRLSQRNLIGCGGAGEVYKVILPSKQQVAVKKIQNIIPSTALMGKAQHQNNELEVEVDTLGLIRHSNILKLLCCITSQEANFKLLVYDYMPNGSLYDRLHHPQSPEMALQWPIRYNIAVGAARGLSYMHHDCSPPILHRDVKSSNILLDTDLKPKIADFGLCRVLQNLGDLYAVSGYVGTHGYIAPEYADRVLVSSKSDVYSFGVVLLELVSGKKATGEVEFGEGVDIVRWVRSSIWKNGGEQGVLDPHIDVQKNREEMVGVLRVGLMCTNKSPGERPSMRKVVEMLVDCKPPTPPQSWKGGEAVDDSSLFSPEWQSENYSG